MPKLARQKTYPIAFIEVLEKEEEQQQQQNNQKLKFVWINCRDAIKDQTFEH